MISKLNTALSSSFEPKYRIIFKFLSQKISDHELKPGQQLLPHRQLAAKIFVTSVTVSRAYRELEKNGLIISRVGKGSFVKSDNLTNSNQGEFHNYRPERSFYDLSRSSSILTNDVMPALHQTLKKYDIPTLSTIVDSTSITDSLGDYGPEIGHLKHREAGLQWLSRSGIKADVQQIACTNGAQHALLCAILVSTCSGDTIVSEAFTYPGIIQLCRQLGRKLVGLAYDESGLLPEALASFCECNTCNAIYLSPQIHNPTGTVMRKQRRLELAEICRYHNIMILEDDVFGLLPVSREKPIQFYAQERTLFFSSLSKVFMPGLRAGYLVFPSALMHKATKVLRDTCWMSSPLSHQAAMELINSGAAFNLLTYQRNEILRRKAITDTLLNEISHTTSKFSPHYFIELPKQKCATAICSLLHDRGITVMNSESFAISKSSKNRFIRASVSGVRNDSELIEAFRLLVKTITTH
ncbi:PLP-dependent aminotransferase family protein [Thaumasiovibrio sp. DFM-14]|uniref:aminotransferase-like domain-containing protein n=1 Tax=Thaumasiovibrio sp. DFM-14 TaxID=3384792 RepID=UPI0039A14FEA